ncbi:hypothetical protein E1B28_008888 [Marasmius oreades]|uniref:Tyrosinase copper-binding domain-containing protein n=1 Tax=Marasmius oreades TaxID=181124 RepID=A0A9P7USK2_9AGAR|nr:uncharacterized protein E1B28_008888 [Marasmius oreades]KAG7092538.1 hypothetical protein E1B28_008888 [Marasmius oreades]
MYFRRGISIATLLVTLFHQTASVQAQCNAPSLRKEWRELSDPEKQDYHKSVRCLMNKPKERYPDESSVVTRLDDLTYTHDKLATIIHNVANFLPWHRMLVHEHENLLRSQCGYKGPYPYWDWTLDADANAVPTSPVWDAVLGFGGNGVPTGNMTAGFKSCVIDGPYANTTLTIGAPTTQTGPEDSPHCLIREWNNGRQDANGNWIIGDMAKSSYNTPVLRQIYSSTNYFDFEWRLENGPHAYLHNRIGGDMRPHTAPNDPIFYLHHANIDRIWAKWQGDNVTRLHADYSGWNDMWHTQRASINDTMPILHLLDSQVTVRDYMNPQGGRLCYQYTDSS